MSGSLFDEEGNLNTVAYESVHKGPPASGSARCDRLPVYALILGILSIVCVFFANGYLISVLGLLIDAHALNKGTKRTTLAAAAAICCCLAILLYIVCVAAKPLFSDMGWYMNLMNLVNKVFYYTR